MSARWKYAVKEIDGPAAAAFFETRGAADAWIAFMHKQGSPHAYARWRLEGMKVARPKRTKGRRA